MMKLEEIWTGLFIQDLGILLIQLHAAALTSVIMNSGNL